MLSWASGRIVYVDLQFFLLFSSRESCIIKIKMAQQEVLICLEKSERPLSMKEIIDKTRLRERNVQRALRSMVKYKEVHKIIKQGTIAVYKINLGCWK